MPSILEHYVERAVQMQVQDPTGDSGSSRIIIILVIVIVVLIALSLIVYVVAKNKKKAKKQPKYIPGDNLLTKFTRWRGGSRGEYSDQLQPNTSAPSLVGRDGRRSRGASRNSSPDHTGSTRNREADPERGDLGLTTGGTIVAEGGFTAGATITNTTAGGVDRNTSVRSVMTLPSYSYIPRESEEVIAREGDRGGVDIVLEFPETIAEEEQRRDHEMESLYQIRAARRQEQTERDERRVARREARARGDYAELQRLQTESRRRAESAASGDFVTSAALIAQHQANQQERERRVSAVQYSNLGVLRHDGTRLRAGSTDSDNRPLLDSGASISGHSLTPSLHTRGRSASSLSSWGRGSSETQRPDNDGFEFVSLESTRSRASSTSGVSHHSHTPPSGEDVTDLGIQIPAEQPPEYEDAPAYTSPIITRPPGGGFGRQDSGGPPSGPPRLPSLSVVPSIEVTAFSPISRESSTVRR
ncbi:hypothetical protein BLS_000501 [Venturia inaequalis]|uniref:Uncharacterized protein n=1 Tax=Venturia inaequalis TaxID=5025 RepID=A0A8H3VM54_VENIN|nr:hypothetical protein BLS_000501 [Venturia inaequalis]KAE9989463.1 hypothetical protein EG327_002655 [Venturia inaequalis]RDI87038.1 Eburicol 14-alpha-demethylase [Venturia inaequalis]